MVTAFCVFALLYGLNKMMRAAPGAIRFGMENRQAVQGGMNVLRRMFGR